MPATWLAPERPWRWHLASTRFSHLLNMRAFDGTGSAASLAGPCPARLRALWRAQELSREVCQRRNSVLIFAVSLMFMVE